MQQLRPWLSDSAGLREAARAHSLWCSPTRRSFLSGRFPVHITGSQPPTCSNFLPLQFTLLPEKLKEADYETHMASLCPPWLRLAQRSPSHHNHFHLFTWRAGGQGPPGVHDDGPPARQQGLRHAPGRALLLPHPTPPTPTIPSPTPADARSISAARRITTGATPATTRPRPATTRAPGASRTCGRTSSQARRSSMRSTSERSTRPPPVISSPRGV